MVVPVLGRMSDADDDIRSTATYTFASLVKMVPLEVSLKLHLFFFIQPFYAGRVTRSTRLFR